MKPRNARSLDAIADDINKLDRGNIFDVGDLLLEAHAQCEHGDWYAWLDAEFEGSADTAERKMKVAELGSKYRKLRDLNLGVTTLYALADDYEDEEIMPAIIEELAKYATKTRLKPCDAKRVIKTGIGRRRFGDHPDATLAALAGLDARRLAGYGEIVAALQEREPKTDEDAESIVDEIESAAMDAKNQEWLQRQQAVQKEDEEIRDEVESILGTPPDLPPPAAPPEPQRLSADTAWEGRDQFNCAVTELFELCTKPVARFADMFTPTVLRTVSDFLLAVAAADKKETAPPPESKTNTDTNTIPDMLDIPACLDRRTAEAAS